MKFEEPFNRLQKEVRWVNDYILPIPDEITTVDDFKYWLRDSGIIFYLGGYPPVDINDDISENDLIDYPLTEIWVMKNPDDPTSIRKYPISIYEGFDKLPEVCKEYGINPAIPKMYHDYLTDPDDTGSYYLDIPCGTGKTIGLAIACSLFDDMNITYVASTHSRLREFVDTLSYLHVPFEYITESRQLIDNPGIDQAKIIVMTSCMLLQFDYHKLECRNRTSYTKRALVIDELPKILLHVEYDLDAYKVIKSDNYPQRFTVQNYNKLCKLFQGENLYFEFDSVLCNQNPMSLSKRQKVFGGWKYFIKELHKSHLTEPKQYEYNDYYMSILRVYLYKAKISLVMDATADLYSEVLGATEVELPVEKDYYKFIDQFHYLNAGKLFTQRDIIIKDLQGFIEQGLGLLTRYPGPYYLVTHNSGVYDGMGEEKVTNEDFLKYLNTQFKIVYEDPHKDFILCRSEDAPIEVDDFGRPISLDNDLFISNFGRSRGSNAFRNCRTVWLLGSFFLPEQQLSTMIEQNKFSMTSHQLMINLAIADAVQEISRGCLRKRDPENKMNVLMIGDQDVINGTIEYLGINNASELQE